MFNIINKMNKHVDILLQEYIKTDYDDCRAEDVTCWSSHFDGSQEN